MSRAWTCDMRKTKVYIELILLININLLEDTRKHNNYYREEQDMSKDHVSRKHWVLTKRMVSTENCKAES